MVKKQAAAATAAEAASGPQAGSGPAKDKPVHEVRIGKIKAVIWQNQTDNGVRHNVTLRRLFKRDSASQWEQSDSLGRDDLPVAMEALHEAWRWIYSHAC